LFERISTDKSILFQSVELSVIYLKSDLITGPVIVGVRPTLPVQGLSLLLDNNLAGGKVVPDPIFCEKLTSNITFKAKDIFLDSSVGKAPELYMQGFLVRFLGQPQFNSYLPSSFPRIRSGLYH
jgi:hypothetical protein